MQQDTWKVRGLFVPVVAKANRTGVAGYFTASLTYDYYQNAYQSLFGNMTWDEIKPVVDWIRQNDDWVRKSVMVWLRSVRHN
jgi:hypothetical protein